MLCMYFTAARAEIFLVPIEQFETLLEGRRIPQTVTRCSFFWPPSPADDDDERAHKLRLCDISKISIYRDIGQYRYIVSLQNWDIALSDYR